MACRYSKTRNFRIHPGLDALLVTAAREQGIGASELIRSIVQCHFEQQHLLRGDEVGHPPLDPIPLMYLVEKSGGKISKQVILDSVSNVWNQDFFCVQHTGHRLALVLIPLVAPKTQSDEIYLG